MISQPMALLSDLDAMNLTTKQLEQFFCAHKTQDSKRIGKAAVSHHETGARTLHNIHPFQDAVSIHKVERGLLLASIPCA